MSATPRKTPKGKTPKKPLVPIHFVKAKDENSETPIQEAVSTSEPTPKKKLVKTPKSSKKAIAEDIPIDLIIPKQEAASTPKPTPKKTLVKTPKSSKKAIAEDIPIDLIIPKQEAVSTPKPTPKKTLVKTPKSSKKAIAETPKQEAVSTPKLTPKKKLVKTPKSLKKEIEIEPSKGSPKTVQMSVDSVDEEISIKKEVKIEQKTTKVLPKSAKKRPIKNKIKNGNGEMAKKIKMENGEALCVANNSTEECKVPRNLVCVVKFDETSGAKAALAAHSNISVSQSADKKKKTDFAVSITNIPHGRITATELHELLKSCGSISSLRINKNSTIAYFETNDQVQQALTLDGKRLGRNAVRIVPLSKPSDSNSRSVQLIISKTTNEMDIHNNFNMCGKIASVKMLTDIRSGKTKCAFINFVNSESVKLALQLNRSLIKGYNIQVQEATKCKSRSLNCCKKGTNKAVSENMEVDYEADYN